MSRKIDEQVVSMEFDNKNFESNVKTTMSTLDRLKTSLKFDGATKGLDEVSSAAKKLDFNSVNKSIETVKTQFSALQVIGTTALVNIANSAVNAGKQMINALTFAPVKAGLSEYETQINAIQTIWANTKSKGTTIDQINSALDELNTYADQTIYNFTEMTKNIGTFTAAGVDLDKATNAIKGIANLGAMAGSTSAQVSTAMYQLSQALATGRVSLMDWNSVVNAGMGGTEFQNALKRTAENFGTDVDAMIEKYGSFRESLTQGGWLTADVLTETLNQLAGAYSDADLLAKGYSQEQVAQIQDLAQTAELAATQVTGFTKMIDTLQEQLGSGWTTTWMTIFGSLDDARTFFTDMTNYIGDFIQGMSDARNALLSSGFDSSWDQLSKKIEDAGVPLDKFQQTLSQVVSESGQDLNSLIEQYDSLGGAIKNGAVSGDQIVETLKRIAGGTAEASGSTEDLNAKLQYFQDVVDRVWRGDFKNAPERYKLLADAGYDYAKVQDLVNKTVDHHRLTLEDLGDAQLQAIGYTDEEIAKIRELADQAEQSGTSINDLIKTLERPSGRELFTDALLTSIKAILEPLKAIGRAFSEVFAFNGNDLYGMIEGFNRLSKAILMSDDTLDELYRTFRGVFSIVRIFTSIISGGLGIAFNVLVSFLENFDINLLQATAFVGDVVYAFTQWINTGQILTDVINFFSDILGKLPGPLQEVINWLSKDATIKRFITEFNNAKQAIQDFFTGVGEYINKFSDLDPAEKLKQVATDIVNFFSNIGEHIQNAFVNINWNQVFSDFGNIGSSLKAIFDGVIAQAQAIGPDILAGLQNGLMGGIGGILGQIASIAQQIITTACSILGIHSPSTVFFDIGQNIIQGLVNGINSMFDGAADVISNLIGNIKDIASEIDWGAVFGIGVGIGSFTLLYKGADAVQSFANAAENLTTPLGELKDVGKHANKVLDSVAKTFKTFRTKIRADAMKSIATAILELAGAVALLTLIDQSKLGGAVGAIAAIAAVITAMSITLDKLNSGSIGDAISTIGTLVSLGLAFVAIAGALKIISTIQGEGLDSVIAVIGTLGAIVGALVVLSSYPTSDVKGVGKMMAGVGAAFIALASALKIITGLIGENGDTSALDRAEETIAKFGIVLMGLIAVAQLFPSGVEDIGKFMSKAGLAFIELAAALAIINTIPQENLGPITDTVGKLGILMMGLIAVSMMAGPNIGKIGTAMIAMGAAFAIMGYVTKELAGLDSAALDQGIDAIQSFAIIMGILVALGVVMGSGKIAQVGTGLLEVAAAIALLGGISIALAQVDKESLLQGISAMTLVSGIVLGLVGLLKLMGGGQIAKIGASLLMVSLAIGILAGISVALGMVDPGNLAKGIVAVGFLSLFVGALVVVSRKAKNVQGTMIGIAAAIGVMAAAVAVLSFIDPNKLGPAVAAIGVLTALIALVENQSKHAKGAMGAIIAIDACVVAIGAVLVALSFIDPESNIKNATALAIVLGSIAVALKVLDSTKKIAASALVGLVAVTAVVAGIAGMLYMLGDIDPDASIANAESLSLVLATMTGVLVVLQAVKSVSAPALVGLAAIGLVVAEIAVILGAMDALNIEPSMETVQALSYMLGTMTGVFTVLAILSPLAAGVPAAAGALIVAITELGGFLIAVGALNTYVPQVQQFIDQAAPLLESLGSALGSMIGGFVGGALESLSGSLGTVADNLSDFMKRLQPFLENVNTVDEGKVTAVGNIVAMVAALTGASFISAIGDFLGLDFSGLGEKLVDFGDAVKQFSEKIEGIDAESVTAAANAGQAIAALATALPAEGGFMQSIFGQKVSLDSFAEQLVAFGDGMQQYATKVAGLDTAAIQNSIPAGESLAELAKKLPSEGGIFDSIFGSTQDFATFGSNLESYGDSLMSYAESVAGLDTGAIETSVTATDSLAQLGDKLPEEGGWFDQIAGGKMDFKSFGEQITAFGDALSDYSSAVSGIDFSSVSSATTQARRILSFLNEYQDFESGSADGITDGIKGLANALSQFTPDIGSSLMISSVGLSAFSAAVGPVASIDFASIASGLTMFGTSVSTLPAMVANAGAAVSSAMTQIVASIITAGPMIAVGFTAAMTMGAIGITAATPMIVAAGLTMARSFTTSTASAIVSGGATVVSAITTMFAAILAAIITFGTAANSTAKTYGTMLMKSYASGISSGGSQAVSTMRSIISQVVASMNQGASQAYSIGRNISSGLARGIAAGQSGAISAARNLAVNALNAAKSALDVNSPSKEFEKLGMYSDEGLAQGFTKFGGIVETASRDVAVSSLNTMADSFSKMDDIIQNGVDVKPTISPVLDLNNLSMNTRQASNMLNLNGSVDVSKINASNLNLAQEIIDGQLQTQKSNQQVIDSVNGLRDDLNNFINAETGDVNLYIDGKQVASTTGKAMNRKLQVLSQRGGLKH